MIGKRLAKLDQAGIETIRAGILEVLALGYVGVMSSEPRDTRAEKNADLERVWNLTVRLFRGDGLRHLPLPPHVISQIDEQGPMVLERSLREADALGWRRGRTPLLGRYYGNAGGLIRAAQVGFVLPSMNAVGNIEGDRWPFAEYVRSG